MNGGTARAWKEPTNDNAYKAHMTSEMLISMQNSETGVSSLKSQVVSLQTAHSWANAGVLLGDACIGSRLAFEAIKLLG